MNYEQVCLISLAQPDSNPKSFVIIPEESACWFRLGLFIGITYLEKLGKEEEEEVLASTRFPIAQQLMQQIVLWQVVKKRVPRELGHAGNCRILLNG